MKKLITIVLVLLSAHIHAQTDSIASDTLKLPPLIASDEVKLTVYPNPTAGNTSLKMHLMRAQYLKVDITDLQGVVIRNVVSQLFSSSDPSVYIETFGLAGGTYLLSVQTEAGNVLATTYLKIAR